jgi:hypothetical protein
MFQAGPQGLKHTTSIFTTVPMQDDRTALVRVHGGAFNARDVESIAGHYLPHARCICDGHFVGEGIEGLRKAVAAEHERGEVVGHLVQVDGEACLVEMSGPEGRREPMGVLRLEMRGGRVSELRIDHDADLARRLVERAASR